ncbi:MAG: acyl-CoA thioesterase [Aureliella sp.]
MKIKHTADHPFVCTRTVVESEIDGLNHVNNLDYLRWTNWAARQHSAAVGWAWQRFRDQGTGFVVREHHIQYRLPALLGEDVSIETWIDSFERFSSNREYRIRRSADGRLLAKANTIWAYVDFRSMRLAQIPDEVVRDFGETTG